MRLIEVTAPQEKLARDRATHAAWGANLTVDQYAEREARLRAHPWAARVMRTWFWVDASDRVLASCETFRTPSWHEGRPSHSYGVASVFTEPELRGRGYAQALMDALVAKLRADEPKAHAITLYSDVGAALYARSGYVERPGMDLIVPSHHRNPQQVDALIDEASLPRELEAMQRPKDGLVLWPDADQLDWHRERSRIYFSLHGKPLPAAVGARVGESRLLWHPYFNDQALRVLLDDLRAPADLGPLLSAAATAASEAGLPRVIAWVTPRLEQALRAAGLTAVPRDGSLPMIRPLAPEVKPSEWAVNPRGLWV